MRKNKIMIPIIIMILSVLTIGVGLTYSYFTASVSGNNNTYQNVITTGNMALAYNDNLELNLNNAIPGDSLTKTFSITNTGTVETTYTIYLSELLNVLADKSDLVYSLTSSDANVNIRNTQMPNDETAILENKSIGVNQTHNYSLTMTFLNKNENQDDNKGTKFSAKISINEYHNYKDNLPYESRNINVTKKVTNVEELKTASSSVGDIIETKGYYEADDQGAAYYTIEEQTNQTIDNGKYILLDNGLVANLMSIDDSYNIRQFGAKGDGVTDDLSAIEAMKNHIANHTLYVPKGTYMMSNRVWFHRKNNITIIGEGEESLFKAMKDTPVGAHLFHFESVHDITFSKISISGNIQENPFGDTYNDHDGIRLVFIMGGENVIADSCNFVDNAAGAFRMSKGGDYNGVFNIKVTNSKFLTVDCGVGGIANGNGDNILIENNIFDGHEYSEPITFFSKVGTIKNVVINNNRILNKLRATAIYLAGFSETEHPEFYNFVITNNYVENSAGGVIIRAHHNTIISDNEFNNIGDGIRIHQSSDVEVYNNIVNRTDRFGVLLNESTNVNFHNNSVADCGIQSGDFKCLDIRGVNTNVNVYSNTIARTDDSLSNDVAMVHGDGGVRIYENTFSNGRLLLYTDSSNMYVANNIGTVKDRGTNNTVIN